MMATIVEDLLPASYYSSTLLGKFFLFLMLLKYLNYFLFFLIIFFWNFLVFLSLILEKKFLSRFTSRPKSFTNISVKLLTGHRSRSCSTRHWIKPHIIELVPHFIRLSCTYENSSPNLGSFSFRRFHCSLSSHPRNAEN